jgi:uncharacterized protein DUF5916/cellulose/xylan binding protein with CBM9 domain
MHSTVKNCFMAVDVCPGTNFRKLPLHKISLCDKYKKMQHLLPAWQLVFVTYMLLASEKTIGQASLTDRSITIHRSASKIIIDGELNEEAWQGSAIADSFINKWPTDTGKAKLQTEIKILYDGQFIYFGIKAVLDDKTPVIQSLKRDVNPYYSDGVSVVIDPSGEHTSGYTFGINAANAQMEGIAQVNSVSFEWDAKWYSQTKIFNGYWTAEIAIPFKSLRFPESLEEWRINFIRNDMTNNCFSTWNQVPIQFFGANLNCLGKVIYGDGIPRLKSNNAVIPYISGRAYEANNNYTSTFNAGLDAKMAINSSLNLDATINPDFSQVDVDRQIINFDRFDVLLPERRTFFLENNDLFANMGLQNIATPFVSRRIGLTGDGGVVPIIAGLRLTGNLDPRLRIGFMNIEVGKKYGLPSQNYTVAAIDQRVFKYSNFRAMFTNRQAVATGDSKKAIADFNRVAGAEFNFLSGNTKFNGRAGYYHSFNPGNIDSSGFGMVNVGYTDKKVNVSAGWHGVNTNFIADAGFTPRLYNYDALNDTVTRIRYNAFTSSSHYVVYPRSKKTINSIDLAIQTNNYATSSGRFIEFNGIGSVDLLFANRREGYIAWVQNSVTLLFPTLIFAETGLLQTAKYNFGFVEMKFLSNFLRKFSWSLDVQHGGYYNGKRTTLTGNTKYRAQPWGNFGIDFIYNDITLNGRKTNPYIIGPPVELAFSDKLFWTTFMQYNTQIKNFNINSRLQWRFKPLSDIYLVYTDNYLTEGLMRKNRSLVVRINYWVN